MAGGFDERGLSWLGSTIGGRSCPPWAELCTTLGAALIWVRSTTGVRS